VIFGCDPLCNQYTLHWNLKSSDYIIWLLYKGTKPECGHFNYYITINLCYMTPNINML